MLNKAQVYEKAELAKSRQRAMVNSTDPRDHANAEVYRLAAQEWIDVALSMPSPNAVENVGKPPFNPQTHIDRLVGRWRSYVNSGVQHDSIDAMTGSALDELVAGDRLRRRAAQLQAEGLAYPEAIAKAKDEADRAKARAQQKGKHKPAEVLADDDPRRFVDPDAIEAVVADFRQAFGLLANQ